METSANKDSTKMVGEKASGKVMSKRYKEIAEHVVLIRKMIRKELSS